MADKPDHNDTHTEAWFRASCLVGTARGIAYDLTLPKKGRVGPSQMVRGGVASRIRPPPGAPDLGFTRDRHYRVAICDHPVGTAWRLPGLD